MIVTMCDIDGCYNYETMLIASQSFKENVNSEANDICDECAKYYIEEHEGKVSIVGQTLYFKELL